MIALVAAPTNLGLRPPQPSSVPGCAKAPEALREAGLHSRLVEAGAVDVGVVLSAGYVRRRDPVAGRVRTRMRWSTTAGGWPPAWSTCWPRDIRRWCSVGTAACSSVPDWRCADAAATAWCTSTGTPTSDTPATARSASAWLARTSPLPSADTGRRWPTWTGSPPTSQRPTWCTSAAATTTNTSPRHASSSAPSSRPGRSARTGLRAPRGLLAPS